jgi:hypothetical protein
MILSAKCGVRLAGSAAKFFARQNLLRDEVLCADSTYNIERRGTRPKINSDRKMLTATNDWVRVHPASPVETVAVL